VQDCKLAVLKADSNKSILRKFSFKRNLFNLVYLSFLLSIESERNLNTAATSMSLESHVLFKLDYIF
jgi:hypothetical protein